MSGKEVEIFVFKKVLVETATQTEIKNILRESNIISKESLSLSWQGYLFPRLLDNYSLISTREDKTIKQILQYS